MARECGGPGDPWAFEALAACWLSFERLAVTCPFADEGNVPLLICELHSESPDWTLEKRLLVEQRCLRRLHGYCGRPNFEARPGRHVSAQSASCLLQLVHPPAAGMALGVTG